MTLFTVILIDALGVSIIYPILPALFLQPPGLLGPTVATSTRDFWYAFSLCVFPVGMFLGMHVIGALSDRFGRKKMMMLCLLGSGLIFVAMLFASAAVAIGLITMFKVAPARQTSNEVWTLGYHKTFALLNVFAIRMAAVCMISTSTIALRTYFINRWLAIFGLGIALVLLVVSDIVPYINLLMPFWVLLVSVDVLVRNRREAREAPGKIQPVEAPE